MTPIIRDANRISKWTDALQTIAKHSSSAESTFRLVTRANWMAANRLIQAVRPMLKEEARKLRTLLEKCGRILAPLEDPFEIDLDKHRWLTWEREEAYSDWLEWVVRQSQSPDRVFQIFGLKPLAASLGGQQFEVRREVCVPHGHVSQSGRLDLVIRYGREAIIVVEVKTTHADDADTAKQKGYSAWLKRQPIDNKYPLILATAATKDVYGGFSVRKWADLCIELRLWVAKDLCETGHRTTATMVLAFVAAVEQNLLGFSASTVREICKGSLAIFNPAVVRHLQNFCTKANR